MGGKKSNLTVRGHFVIYRLGVEMKIISLLSNSNIQNIYAGLAINRTRTQRHHQVHMLNFMIMKITEIFNQSKKKNYKNLKLSCIRPISCSLTISKKHFLRCLPLSNVY